MTESFSCKNGQFAPKWHSEVTAHILSEFYRVALPEVLVSPVLAGGAPEAFGGLGVDCPDYILSSILVKNVKTSSSVMI